ncbi:hypothetical protein [Methylomonas sp. MgM2]
MKKTTLLLAALALLSAQAYADGDHGHHRKKHQCRSKDLNGDYVMFQAAVNNPDLNHTGRCEVSIADGELSGTCAFDPNVSGNPNFNGPVYGTATMNANCSAEMEIRFRPNPANQEFEVVSNFDVQFTPDKQSLVGKFSNQFGVYGVTNGTRYSIDLPGDEAF